MNPLMLIQFWPYLLIAALGLFTAGWVGGCSDKAKQHESYVVAVKAVGEAQEARTRQTVKTNLERKKVSDAENLKLHVDYAALSKQLRIERASRSVLPARPTAPGSPASLAFDYDALDRALSAYREGVAGLLEEGDQARIDLDTARRWAQQFQGE